jgi:hypothetical protein
VAAQSPVASPVKGDAPTGVLAEFQLRELPAPHAEVWFIRMTLEPDGSLPMGAQGGPMILHVESGELMLALDGPVVTVSGQPASEPGELVLATGESLFVPTSTGVAMTNPADAPASFLMLLMYAAETEGEGGQGMEEPTGLTQRGISVGTAEFMPMPATIAIERVVVEPGGTAATGGGMDGQMGPGWMGMDLGAVESGAATLLVERQAMDMLVWPGMLDTDMPQPERIALGGSVDLAAGDAYAMFNSTLTWTATGDEPLTILRVVITPEMD